MLQDEGIYVLSLVNSVSFPCHCVDQITCSPICKLRDFSYLYILTTYTRKRKHASIFSKEKLARMDSLSQFLVPLFITTPFFLMIFLYKRRHSHAKRLPPSPRKLPVIGNLHQLGVLPHRSLRSLSKKHGPLMLLHFGRVPVLVVSSADVARELLKSNESIFSARPKLTMTDKLFYGARDVAFAPYGEFWRHVRSICVLQLLSVKRVQSFRRVREEETSLVIDNIRKSGNSVINLSTMLVLLTNDIVCRATLGRKFSNRGEGEEFKKKFHEIEELLGTFCVGDYIPWLAWIDWASGLYAKAERLANWLDHFFQSVIEERRSMTTAGEISDDHGSTGFVDILLQFQRENTDKSVSIEDDVVKAIILDMFVAGTDTSYTVLEWTMTELLRNPNTMQKLQQEVRRVAGEKGEVTEDDLAKMQYLKAVIKESLRLHTPAPLLVPRESTQDTKIMGYDIAAGTQLYVNAWSIARDPSLWENPDEFLPERFLDSTVDFRGLHFEFIPFGAGRRGCPGMAFGMAVDELVLAKLVHAFDFELPDGARNNDQDVAEAAGMTVHRRFPLLVVATPYT